MIEEKRIREFSKKLTLNKKTVANLNDEAMNVIKAGWAWTDRTHCTCDLPCPDSGLPSDIC